MINRGHTERAWQNRHRSRSQERRRQALERDKWPQTADGRRWQQERATTQQMTPRQTWTADDSPGVIAVAPQLVPWHQVPGSSIEKLLEVQEHELPPRPSEWMPPMPSRPPPSAEEATPPIRGSVGRYQATELANRRAFQREQELALLRQW